MENQQPSPVEKKTCKVCRCEKPIPDFHVFSCKSRKVRITDVCILCHKAELHKWYLKRKGQMTPEKKRIHAAYSKKWRDNHPEQRKAISLRNHYKSRDRDRNLVYAYYGGKCACCGENERQFLTVDHINNDGHIERKKGFYTNGSQFYRWIVKNNFPKDYQLLCYNCNLGRARNGGICPHRKGSEIRSADRRAERPEAPATHKGDDMIPTSDRKAELLN